MPNAQIIDKHIFFTKLIEAVIESYDKDYVGHSVGIRNLHVMILTENYDPERFEKASNLSAERILFLGEIQVMVEADSMNYIYFL